LHASIKDDTVEHLAVASYTATKPFNHSRAFSFFMC
jgi:hypothetical protein